LRLVGHRSGVRSSGLPIAIARDVPQLDRELTHPRRVKSCVHVARIVALIAHDRSEATLGKSTYEIRVFGIVPLELLENFRQIKTVEPAGTILHAVAMDDAGLWGLIDALRDAGVDLIEIRRDVGAGD